jgi:hypothetical protein
MLENTKGAIKNEQSRETSASVCCYLLSSIWKLIQILASLFVGHAAQKSKLHNLQYDEGGNHVTEAETEAEVSLDCSFLIAPLVFSNIPSCYSCYAPSNMS